MTVRKGFAAALAAALSLCTIGAGGGAARAAELVMVELKGCPWCAKWHREIGPVYGKTEEGAQLPLRRVLLGSAAAGFKPASPVKVAPTFVVVECGAEIGRIVGYAGDEMFWGELSVILDRMKAKGQPKPAC